MRDLVDNGPYLAGEALAKGLVDRLGYWDEFISEALGGAGDFDAANEFIDDADSNSPANPARAAKWRRDLDSLRAYVRELETSKP